MESTIETSGEQIREIEDIINIQKANGNFHSRQVAFALPSSGECEGGGGGGAGGTCAARSLDSGLWRAPAAPPAPRAARKQRRARRSQSPLADAVSWPSDSDITVLRMKGCALGPLARDKEGGAVAGDGLNRADGSSMVNLATLVLPSRSASKHRQELLLPLTSWEGAAGPGSEAGGGGARARLARFLRLYFCPCCTCLYEMEKSTRGSRDAPSVYLTSARAAPAPAPHAAV